MFLESTYTPEYAPRISRLKIADIAILTAHLGDKPYLARCMKNHLTAEDIQLVCYFAQGLHISKTGRSLFSDDFYVTNNRIENPTITELFGRFNTVVTPFEMTERFKNALSPIATSFNAENNNLVRAVAYKVVPMDNKTIMHALRQTEPYINALADENKRISKKDIKTFFDSLLVKKDAIDSSWSISDVPIFMAEEEKGEDINEEEA